MLELSNKQLDVGKQLTNCVQGECKPSRSFFARLPDVKAYRTFSDHAVLNGSFVQAR